MNYMGVLQTLHEFDLITDEQMEAAWADWQQSFDEYQERKDKFREEWKTTSSWWHRFWGDWTLDWFKHERERGEA